jgi:hypothetical protein
MGGASVTGQSARERGWWSLQVDYAGVKISRAAPTRRCEREALSSKPSRVRWGRRRRPR